jgi:sigma-B regulation protein RsbU (phosphoserine phosphatase)
MVAMFQVLIVEDDSELREVLRRSLIRLGCQVSIAESSEEGLDKLSSEKYDAVFASLCVRAKGGRCVARFVKNQCSNTKFFLVTGWKGELEAKLLKLDGIHEIIHKPINFSEIRDKVLEILG